MKIIRDEFSGKYIRAKRFRLCHPQTVADTNRRCHLRSHYGITRQDLEAFLALQHHRCAICGNGFRNYRDCLVDHDHVTGKVRGLLCRACNFTIGHTHDNSSILENAAKYLRGEIGPIVKVRDVVGHEDRIVS